jgi:hypothetical protein
VPDASAPPCMTPPGVFNCNAGDGFARRRASVLGCLLRVVPLASPVVETASTWAKVRGDSEVRRCPTAPWGGREGATQRKEKERC